MRNIWILETKRVIIRPHQFRPHGPSRPVDQQQDNEHGLFLQDNGDEAPSGEELEQHLKVLEDAGEDFVENVVKQSIDPEKLYRSAQFLFGAIGLDTMIGTAFPFAPNRCYM